MTRQCICCHQKGHRIMDCPKFHEEMRQPSVGTCGRCGGRGMFMPYVDMPAKGKVAERIEARLLCACCSYATCPHTAAAVAP